jgi:xylose isomerase
MDLFSLQNLNDYSWQLTAKPMKKLKLEADLHLLYLDTPKDSWYSAGRTVTRTASAALSDVNSHLGNEVDLVAQYQLNPMVNVMLGYSHLFAGKYMKQTGTHDDADFVYLQTEFKL